MSYRDDWMEIPSAETAANESAREQFEGYREKMIDDATDLHEAGKEAEAQALLAKAKALNYTGLHWQEDNGLMDDLYGPKESL